MPACTSSPSPRRVARRAGSRAVVRHLLDHLATPAGHHGGGLAGPVEGRGPGAGPAQHEHHGRKPGQVGLDGVRPEVDVVTEEDRRFVAVDRAPDVGQDADVIEGGQVARRPTPAAHPGACRSAPSGPCARVAVRSRGRWPRRARPAGPRGGCPSPPWPNRTVGPAADPGPWGECLMTAGRPFLTVKAERPLRSSRTEEGDAQIPHRAHRCGCRSDGRRRLSRPSPPSPTRCSATSDPTSSGCTATSPTTRSPASTWRPREDIVREHGRCGGFPVDAVHEVRSVIDPTTAELVR